MCLGSAEGDLNFGKFFTPELSRGLLGPGGNSERPSMVGVGEKERRKDNATGRIS